MTIPANRLANIRRRVNRARDNVGVTCPASRHVHQIADALGSGKPYAMLEDEPQHVASSLYAVLESLWKLRAKEKSCRPGSRSGLGVVSELPVNLNIEALPALLQHGDDSTGKG